MERIYNRQVGTGPQVRANILAEVVAREANGEDRLELGVIGIRMKNGPLSAALALLAHVISRASIARFMTCVQLVIRSGGGRLPCKMARPFV